MIFVSTSTTPGNPSPTAVPTQTRVNRCPAMDGCSSSCHRGALLAADFTPKFENDQIWARVGMPGSQMSYNLSASQCTRTAGDPGGACNAPANAKYEGTTPSGSRVFFSTTQQLVNADTDETRDLYACDIPPAEVAPVGLANPCPKLTLVSNAATGAEVENLVRTSADGKTAYFFAKGVLASNTDALGETARSRRQQPLRLASGRSPPGRADDLHRRSGRK